MACSSVSTAASSEDEKKEQRLIDVVFLCDEWKSSKGGLSTFNREFAINLAETTTRSMKIHCYVSKSDDRDREDAKQHGVNLITAETVPGSRDPLDWLKVPPSGLQHPYVVIGHGRKLGTPACHIVRAAKCKWIQFVHVFCEDLGKFKEAPATAVTDTIEENEEKHKREIELCKAADAVVAVGSRLQRKYSKSLPKIEVKIITPGIVEKFCNESIESGNPAGVLSRTLTAFKSYRFMKKFNVFLFGRASYEDLTLKGYDIVANSIGSLGKKFELTFVGSPPGGHRNLEQWFLQKTCIKRKQITIRGYCTEQDELKEMFHQSDLVALPSRTEGFGLVALEAISSGVPILVSGQSGVAEALQKVEGGNSVIVESDDDAVEWARRISEMSSQSPEEREAKARQLRENYRKVYSWRKECERFKALIENVVKTANGDELNITIDVEDQKPAESNGQTTTSIMESEKYKMDEPSKKSSVAPDMQGSVNCPDTEYLQALREEFFLLAGKSYLKTTPPQNKEERDEFMEFLENLGAFMTRARQGSLVITVKCKSLQILEELWREYLSGHMGEVVQNCFVKEKTLKELNLAELKLKTTMDIEEYNACKVYFERIALRDALSAQSYIISTEDEAQIERWKQNTEVVESENVKSSSPILEMSTTGHNKEGEEPQETMKGILPLTVSSSSDSDDDSELEGRLKTFTLQEEKRILPPSEEELEELLMKLQSMKDTSPSTKLPTAGHGKELEGKLKTMTLQEKKRTWPVHEFSASDPEEDLAAEQRMKLQGMEVTSPSAAYRTTGHEKEKKGTSLSTKLSTVGHGKELEGKLKTMKLQEEKSILPLSEEEPEGLLMKLQRMKGQKKELERRQKTIKIQGEKGSLPSSPLSTTDLEEKLEEVFVKLMRLRKEGKLAVPESSTSHLVKKLAELCMELIRLRMEGTLPPPELFTAHLEEELKELDELVVNLYQQRYEDRHLIWTFHGDVRELLRQLQEKRTEGSLPSSPLSTTDLEEKLEEVCVELMRLRKEGSVPALDSSTSHLEEKLAELCTKLRRLRMEGTLPPPELFTANLEEELEELLAKLNRQRCEGSSSLPDNTFEIKLIQLLEKLKKKKMEVTMYPTIRSGLEKFDVSLPEELQSYVSYLFNESAKLGLRRRVLLSPSAVKDFLEAMDEHELKTFLTIHIREGAWQVVLLFTDEVPSDKLPRDWFDEMWDRHKGEETVISSLYSSTSGILKAWPTEYDPDLVTLCKAITNLDWKVTRLILSGSRISDEGLKNLSTALTQSELYSLALCANDLQSQGLKHLCEALISGNCDLISLSVTRNGLGEEGIMHLCDVLTSNNCKLNSLNVSQNFFGNEGIKLLCDALISANCTLTSLKASWNVLGDEGIMPLARALTNKNCALTSLDISFNRIGDEGTKFLCKALTDTNCKLRSLNLHGNLKVTDVGKQCLSEAITGTDWEVREGLILSLSIKSEAQ